MVKIYWIIKYTTTGNFLPLFSSELSSKMIQSIFTSQDIYPLVSDILNMSHITVQQFTDLPPEQWYSEIGETIYSISDRYPLEYVLQRFGKNVASLLYIP